MLRVDLNFTNIDLLKADGYKLRFKGLALQLH